MRLWKVLSADLSSMHGGSQNWVVGEWVDAKFENGRKAKRICPAAAGALHFCRDQDLIHWLGPAICPAEVEGEILIYEDGGSSKVCALRGRITGSGLETWDERAARLFAADCAERVLTLFETKYPDDDRPRKAIAASRAFARGEIDAAAWAAARDAARAAAWAAAGAAAGAAAWAAARAAAWATRAAAWAAEGAAAGDAERDWQTARLISYLEGSAND